MKFNISLDHDFYNVSMTVGARRGMTSSPAEIWEDPQPKLLPDWDRQGRLWLGAGGAGGAEVLRAEATDG